MLEQGLLPSGRKDLEPLSLFRVGLKVEGSLRPGHPASVTVLVEAQEASAAEVALRLPELRVVEGSGRGLAFHLPRHEAPAEFGYWRSNLPAGGQAHYSVEVLFPAAGLYQVHVTVTGKPAEDAVRDVQPVTHRSVWVLIADRGGRVTEAFDSALLPKGALRAPGPVRYLSALSRAIMVDTSRSIEMEPSLTVQSTSCTIGPFYCDAYVSAVYYDQDTGFYRAVANALVVTEYYDRDPYSGDPIFVGGEQQYTDVDGRYRIDCTLYSYDTDQVIVNGNVRTTNGEIALHRGDEGSPYMVSFNHGRVYDVCNYYLHGYEYVYDVTLAPNQSRVFNNSVRAARNSRTLMGYSRSRVKVKVYDTGTGANYSPSPFDDIQIYGNAIWGNYGRFTAAHEYGHALHEKGLGGNVASGSCPSPHFLRSPSNTSCAFSEGLADFHAALTLGMDMTTVIWGYWDYSLQAAETNWRDPGGGSATESKVGAFFLDLADVSSSPDNVPGDDDPAAYGGPYVGRAIKDCWITWREDVSVVNEDGIVQQITQRAQDLPDLIHCLKSQVTTTGRLTMSSLDSQGNIITLNAVSASPITQASGWSQASVQTIWNSNIAN